MKTRTVFDEVPVFASGCVLHAAFRSEFADARCRSRYSATARRTASVSGIPAGAFNALSPGGRSRVEAQPRSFYRQRSTRTSRTSEFEPSTPCT